MTDIDDWEDSAEYEARQRAAEEPPESYFIEQAERDHERHRAEEHRGGECDCPPPAWPRCRRLLTVPRWSPRKGWHAGTPNCCETWRCRTPRAAWRTHGTMHEAPF